MQKYHIRWNLNSIVNVRDLVKGEINNVYNSLDDTDVKINQVQSNLTAHINAINPHNIRPSQMFTFSTAAPVNTQGNVGDVWVQYLTITV